MSEDRKLEGDVNWIKNIFPEAVNFIKQELISEFVNDLKKLRYSEGLKEKWEERLK